MSWEVLAERTCCAGAEAYCGEVSIGPWVMCVMIVARFCSIFLRLRFAQMAMRKRTRMRKTRAPRTPPTMAPMLVLLLVLPVLVLVLVALLLGVLVVVVVAELLVPDASALTSVFEQET